MDVTLLKQVNNLQYSRAESEDFDNTKVYKVEGEESTLFYWNSSNSAPIRHQSALKDIQSNLLDDLDGGTVNDGWNEIMFEVR